jgi:hypothetical protein
MNGGATRLVLRESEMGTVEIGLSGFGLPADGRDDMEIRAELASLLPRLTGTWLRHML